MKQIFFILAIFCLGAISFWAVSGWFNERKDKEMVSPEEAARLEAQRLVEEAKQRQTNTPATTEAEEISTVSATDNSVNDESQSDSLVEGPFTVVGSKDYPASGQAKIIRSPEETLIQYLNYEGVSGPDLYVYLAKDLNGADFISLGPVQGNKGDFIYGAPLDIDFAEYKYLLVWSVTLGELFNYAKID